MKFVVFGLAACLSGVAIGVVAINGLLPVQSPVAPVAASPPVNVIADPVPPDPSVQIAADTQALAVRAGTTYEGIARWAKAIDAGLPAQPGEIETLRAQASTIDQDARAIRDRADAGGISPHVQRAADSASEATHEMLIGTDLASEAVNMLNKKQVQGVQTVVDLATGHFTHAAKLIDVASDEMHAFQSESAQ